MDKGRSSKHAKRHPKKSSKKSKRRHHSRDNPSGVRISLSHRSSEYPPYKIVEYSDVSSEDFSAPEAGEIEDEESFSLSDKESSMLSAPSASILINNIENSKSTTPRMSFEMSPQTVRKVIFGSPISSSMSSATSRSKMQHSLSPMPQKHISRKNVESKKSSSTTTSIIDENEIDDLDDIDDEEDGEEMDDDDDGHRRRKSKKSKKKKSKKKKKKRRKSISSIESISDNESLLDDTAGIASPTDSVRPMSPYDKGNYTPIKPSPMSPATPPLRPNSNASMYSDTTRRTPSRSNSKSMYIASPHTPPIVPNKKTSYHSPMHVDIAHSTHHGSHHHYHHSHHHHQPRSPAEQAPQSSSRRVSKSPGNLHTFLSTIYIQTL